jgi:hypothetical protein
MTDTTTTIPDVVQRLIDLRQLDEQAQPNPEPRPGNRAVHTTATRLWTGGRSGHDRYLDDGYDLITEIEATFGWRPSADYGDWPMVVEYLRSWHLGGRDYRHFRLTYLEGSVYLAEYATSRDMLADAWKNEAI